MVTTFWQKIDFGNAKTACLSGVFLSIPGVVPIPGVDEGSFN